MRKCAFFSMLVLLFVVHEHADAVGIRSYGVKVGLVQAGQTWDYSGTASNLKAFEKQRSGLSAGGYIEWLDIPIVSLVVEAQYVQKGCREDINITSEQGPLSSGTKAIRPRLDYLSIPVLLKIRYGFAAGSVYALAGPRYDFLIGKKSEGVVDSVFDKVKSADYGVTLGVGVEVAHVVTKSIGVEFLYNPSLRKIYTAELLAIKNSSLELKLVVGF